MSDSLLQNIDKLRGLLPFTEIRDFDYWSDLVFEYQCNYNKTFRNYLEIISANADDKPLKNYLPIQFFKNHEVKTGDWSSEKVFGSSATTGISRSYHHIRTQSYYHSLSERIFKKVYNISDKVSILALLPGYLERQDSSLVSMVNNFINSFGEADSGFYIKDFELLYQQLLLNKEKKTPTFLFGVSFALLEFAENYAPINFPNLIVIETGGMKGQRHELPREELHEILKSFFSVNEIHSEYGMTELLSQAYSKGEGRFVLPDTMKIVISEISDPFSLEKIGKPGILNIIDLANLDTCSFIRTEDIAILHEDGSFSVLGRADGSEPRGCNLLF